MTVYGLVEYEIRACITYSLICGEISFIESYRGQDRQTRGAAYRHLRFIFVILCVDDSMRFTFIRFPKH